MSETENKMIPLKKNQGKGGVNELRNCDKMKNVANKLKRRNCNVNEKSNQSWKE